MKNKTGIHQLAASDPAKADLTLWGRVANPISRRGFLKGLGSFSAIVGAEVVFAPLMPAGLIPAAYANSDKPFAISGKDGLTILNDRPVNAETPPHLLNDDITPVKHLFVRNNGLPPTNVDAKQWTLTIGGESVKNSKTYTIADLKSKFETVKLQLTLECGGNGRSEYDPPARGNQWTLGAVGCPLWHGVRLKEVLADCGIKDDAVYIGYEGADEHLSRQPGKKAISRGVPMSKALEDESLIVFGMNGEDLHPMNGYPLRLVFGGWPASTSGKWLNKILIRNQIHDGTKMAAPAYSVPCHGVAPGEKVSKQDMCIIESMPVKSLITAPASGAKHPLGKKLALHGHAWAGDLAVEELLLSIDFGQTWTQTALKKPANRLAWQHWDADIEFPKKGYYEVWAKASDSTGRSQPMVVPGWNPKGYLNNSCHRIAVTVV